MSDGNIKWEQILTVASLTDLGMRRTNNQDNFCVSLAQNADQWTKRGHLFIVADGMGAHAAGELASKLAVDQIPLLLSKFRDSTPPERLKRAIVDTNAEIHRKGQANEEFHHMGTTCSALTLSPDGALAAHVGDSRVYRFRSNRLEQLTFDHSLVWEMRAAGSLTNKDDLSKIPKNVITRSLGPYPEVQVDLEGPFPVLPGDSYLLCSDGLTGQVTDEEIGAVLAVLPPAEATRFLIDLANLRGGPDNTTIIIARVNSPLPNTVPSPVKATPAGKSNKKFFAILTALAGILLLVSLIMIASKLWLGLIPAVLAVILLFVSLIKLTSGPQGSASAASGQSYGKGPYTQTDCGTAGWELTKHLKAMAEQILNEAKSRDWKLDPKQLATLLSEGEKALQAKELRTALRSYALTVSDLMNQIRKQPGSGSNSLEI
ncbi:MAG: PP2C family protein-serine/threonine phosphatase [Planctomycetota bacterium]|jgi:protein phosphatase